MTHPTQNNTGGDAAVPAMTDADIDAMVADRAAGTPDLGGWAWFGGRDSLYLATRRGGRRFVMDFVRKGMKSAQPRFQIRGCMHNAIDDLTTYEVGDGTARGQNQAVADSSVYRLDVAGVDHPDARRIARVPAMEQAILALHSENISLRAAIVRQAAASRTLREYTLDEVADLKDMDRSEYNAAKSLDAERDANSILTSEVESLRAELAAIRAIPLPTDADLLAEAMKLPEVRALTHAVASQIAYMDMCEHHGELHSRLVAALAPFTAAKEKT